MPVNTPPPDDAIYSIAEITDAINSVLQNQFRNVWVQGEITGFSKKPSGHWYFKIKDSIGNILNITAFASMNYRVRFDLRNGLEVLVRGPISAYGTFGQYQLNLEQILPKGIGELELAFQQIQTQLDRMGYFDPDRKKPIPKYPTRIAVVTSPTGAVIRDILETLNARWPVAKVLVCPVRVQGEGAKQEIAEMIDLLNRLRDDNKIRVDVMIVGRGGGSMEDLWAFNSEEVAHALYRSRIPIVSAVGHETDVTIACMVADLRAHTPTAAATLLTPNLAELRAGLISTQRQLEQMVRRRIDMGRQQLQAISQRRVLREPAERVRQLQQRVAELQQRIQRATTNQHDRARQSLNGAAARLAALSPLNILARGYSLTEAEDTHLIRSVSQATLGQRIITRLGDGQLTSVVEKIDTKDAQS